MTNLFHGGALIIDADFVPEEAAQVVLMLQSGEEEISFKAHTREITEDDRPASFGLEFSETHQEIEAKMIQLGDTLFPDDSENRNLPGSPIIDDSCLRSQTGKCGSVFVPQMKATIPGDSAFI